MRFRIWFLLLFSLSFPLFASDLHIKVVDPHSATVNGAQVSLYRREATTPLQVRVTSVDGEAVLHIPDKTGLRAQVLAAGFAETWAEVTKGAESLLITLQVARASETVVVIATRTPAREENTASSVSVLSAEQIQEMQPTSFGEAVRFLPGAVVNDAGQRGGLTSLFVRGGDSRYNKMIIDGVPVDESGGTFDFGTVPLAQIDRIEFLRGTESTLYGSDAMTGVLEMSTENSTTTVPELRFGADGGNFGTAHGYASLASTWKRYDYNVFADQFQTNGQGPNSQYFNALQGGNLGLELAPTVALRLRARHSNSRTGVPGIWDLNNHPVLQPDSDTRAGQNNLLGSAELTVAGPSRWLHRITGFEYHHRRSNADTVQDAWRVSPLYGNFDFSYNTLLNFNRAGIAYQGDYSERSWAHTTIGYDFEDENGFFGDVHAPEHGLRLNHAGFVQQSVAWRLFSVIGGVRFAHNETFGNKVVPRVAVVARVLRGGQFFSGTRLRFSYAQGIKEPRFEESFANDVFTLPNPHLKAEQNHAFESGFEQGLISNRFLFSAIYFHNSFRDQIDYSCCNSNFQGRYVNVNRSMAQGAELSLTGKITTRMRVDGAYNYLSTQILAAPYAFDPLIGPGQPLLRRPKHSGSLLLNYFGSRWGADLGGNFVGRRTDSDFLGFLVNHAAGYARVDVGGWYALNSRITAYANVENALNAHFNEVVGYPALTANVRAGLRFRIGGE